jgi:hypothetical protein
MADAADSKSAEGNLVWVRLPPSVPDPCRAYPRRMPRRASRFIGYPTDSLLAVLPDPERAAASAAAVKAVGIADKDITIMRGDEGASRFDPTGAVHGLFARIRRIVSFTVMDQLPDMAWYDAAIRTGQAVVMVRIRGDETKADAVRVLREHGAHFVNYYGRFATEEIVRWQGPDPDIHSLLKR